MRDLDEQLRAWTDQADAITVDDVEAEVATKRVGRDDGDRRGRAAAWALIAAAVLVVAGLAFAVSDDDGDEPPASPGPQTTVVEPAVTTSSSTPMPQVLPQKLGEPETLVGFTADGRLISIDPTTGEERAELASGYSAADEAEVEGGPYVISSVTVDRRSGDLYYATCCEPAVGEIFRVVDGRAERFRNGDQPSLSPDGTKLAFVELQHLKILDLGTGDVIREWSLAADGPIGDGGIETTQVVPSDISWSQDGSKLVMVASQYPGGSSTVRVVEVADTSSGAVFAAAALADGPTEGANRPTLPLFDPDGRVSFVRQDLADDASDGTVVERVKVPSRIVGSPYGPDDVTRSEDTLDAEILSRFLVGGVEWRLLSDGTVTVDGEPRFTIPGLRLLAA